jgi:pilus assembly protein CpaB
MQPYRVFMIVAAVALFGAGVLIAHAFLQAPPPAVAVAPPADVVVPSSAVMVAKSDLHAGQFLGEGDIAWRDRPNNSLRPDLYVKGADSTTALIGAVLLRAVHTGEAIQRGDVVSPHERGFLAAVLTPGKRSISVAVDEVSGNAGLILPGDHVDVIVTHTAAQGENPGRQVVAQVVLEDLTVIAIDQTLRGPTEEIQAEAAKDEKRGARLDLNSQRPRTTARTVTLEVAPHDAEVLAVAANLGKLTLVLRSLERLPATAVVSRLDSAPVWAGDVMRPLFELGQAPAVQENAPPPPPPSSAEVVVLRGGGSAK